MYRDLTLDPAIALQVLSLGHLSQQPALIDAAIQHCGYWEDLAPGRMLDPALGFEGLQQLVSRPLSAPHCEYITYTLHSFMPSTADGPKLYIYLKT